MKEIIDEKNIPTVENSAQAHPRVSLTHADTRGARRNKQTPRERQAQTCGVTITSENKTVNDATVTQPSFSFPKSCKLRLRADFQQVFSNGERFHGKILLLIVYHPAVGGGFKLGLIVRKKIYKRAVDRNKIKRRLREIVRLMRPDLAKDLWLIICVKHGVKEVL